MCSNKPYVDNLRGKKYFDNHSEIISFNVKNVPFVPDTLYTVHIFFNIVKSFSLSRFTCFIPALQGGFGSRVKMKKSLIVLKATIPIYGTKL